MKIAICGFGFSGATLPLAKALSNNENVSRVDCFYLAYRSNSIKSIESIDFHNEKLILGIPHSLHKDNIIYRYLPSNVDVHIVPLCPNGPKWFRWISRFVNIIIIWGLAMYLLKKKYGFINIVAHTSLEFLLIRLVMPFKKVIVSIHEIYQSLNGTKVLKRDLVNILNSKIDVVFHSNSVQREFELRALHRRCKCHTIPFSNFDSYISYQDDIKVTSINNYVLFIGSVQPYKGLSLLKEVFDSEDMKDIKLVIAGKGYVPELEYFISRQNTEVINRYITNQELVSLIKRASFLVCPYLTASQTGIAPTCFVFGKPIIATRVGAFGEVIDESKNGYLIPLDSIDVFREKIKSLYYDKDKQEAMTTYINQIKSNKWVDISNSYLKIL